MEQDDQAGRGIALAGLSRKALANHPLTHEYLEAGHDLVLQALQAGVRDGEAHPFLRWLSRPAVIAAVATRGNLKGNDGTFRDRWTRHADYTGDLVTWIRARRRETRFPVRADAFVQAALGSTARPSTFIRALTRRNLASLFANPLFRFQLLASSVAGSWNSTSPTTSEVDALSFYEEVEAAWQPVVTAFMEAHDLVLRPGVEMADLMAILVAVGEGLALRELGDPTVGHARARRESLQGLTALALLLACTGTDGNTMDEALDEYLSGR